MQTRHRIQFPAANVNDLAQDEVFFFLQKGDSTRRIRLHDYEEIYKIPGLYEQVVYERLQCQSPRKVAQTLQNAVTQAGGQPTELRVLDLGAGNGMVGQELKDKGVARLVGIDIVPEGRDATERDRPGLYDAYYIADFCNLTNEERDELQSWSFDCLTTVAALGFGDIPPKAFLQGLNLLAEDGWAAFNIKESFLNPGDQTGFSRLIRELIFSEHFEVHHLERYRHRYSFEGEPLHYFALVARKSAHIPEDFLSTVGAA